MLITSFGQNKVFADVLDPWWACFNPQMTCWEDNQQVDWLLAALIMTDDWIKQLLRITWCFLGVKDAVLCCSLPLWQCVVYSTWISVQPDPAAAARLPLQSRLLGPGSVTVHLDWIKMEGREMTPELTCVTCVHCPGMVPLPDTAIDFSDLRSQSSRMNERVSRISDL